MYTFHVENGTGMPLMYTVHDVGTDALLFRGVLPPSSEQHRWVHGQNPYFHAQHAAARLNFMIWSVTQPQAPPLLFTMDASKTNHLTLMCRGAFIGQCSPTTMIFVGKQLN